MPGSDSASPRDAFAAREALMALLASAYGSEQEANAAIDHALRDAGFTALPEEGPALLAFVRAHLVPVLSTDLGARLTIALLDDFVAQHEERSGVRAKGPSGAVPFARIVPQPRQPAPGARLRVVLVDSDRVGRTAFARALIRASCEVDVVDTPDQLARLVQLGERVDAAIVDALHPARLALLEGLIEGFPAALLVLRSSAPDATGELLRSLNAARYVVQARHAPAQDVIQEVLTAAVRDA